MNSSGSRQENPDGHAQARVFDALTRLLVRSGATASHGAGRPLTLSRLGYFTAIG